MSTMKIENLMIRSLWEEFDGAVDAGVVPGGRRPGDEAMFFAGASGALGLVEFARQLARTPDDFARVLDAYRAEAEATVLKLWSSSKGGPAT
jgi:hypothetical protein